MYMLKSYWQCDGIRSGAYGGVLGHEGEALMNGIDVLI